MRVAQIVTLFESVPPINRNGLEFVVSWLTEELVRRGHDVTLFAPAASKTNAKLISLFPEKLSQTQDIEWSQPLRGKWNASLASSMSEQFDILHAHTRSLSVFLPFIETKLVQTMHESYPLSLDYSPELEFIAEQYRKTNYVAVSKSQLNDFKINREHYYKEKNCAVVYNGIPINDFEFNEFPKDYLFFIGYMNKKKGPDVAIRVAKKLGMRLILAGRNEYEEKFFDREIKPHLSNKIRYIGPVNFSQKVDLYKNAIATLAPIRWEEPFGLTIAESQASGTPVIAFNRGAASEIIKHGKTGYVVETEKEMLEAVKTVKSLNRKDCRRWIENNFTVEKMTDQYEKLYRKILKK